MEEKGQPNAESPTVEKKLSPVPLPSRKRGQKIFIGLIVALVLLVRTMIYYHFFLASYVSTDDAFIDGYVTMISPRVPGLVLKLMAVDNQQVKAGDVLLELDPLDYETSQHLAQVDLTAARSQVDGAQAQVSEAKIAQAAVVAAETENQWENNDLHRYEAVASRAVSQSAIDQAQATVRSATADLAAARSQTKAAEAGAALSQAGVETATASVQQAKARMEQTGLNLSYTKVVAPRDGSVTARTVHRSPGAKPTRQPIWPAGGTILATQTWIL